MTRNFANRFNHRYGGCFPEPQAFNFSELLKVPSLMVQGKMSKKRKPVRGTVVWQMMMTWKKKSNESKTDQGPQNNMEKPDYIQNIFDLMKLVCNQRWLTNFESDYNNCTIRYGDLKKQLAEDMVLYCTLLSSENKRYQRKRSLPQRCTEVRRWKSVYKMKKRYRK